MKKLFFVAILLITTSVFAECSFKVINHGSKSFQEMGAKASIANLAIVLCAQLSDKDDIVKANCAADPANTLFSHPHNASTCTSTNGWPIYLQFENGPEPMCSDRQATKGKHIVVNYPEDFSAKKCGGSR